MRARSTSWLALLLAFAFVAVGITTAAAKNCDLMAAAQEMEEGTTEIKGMVEDQKTEMKGTAEDQKVEIKGKVEEEKGKATIEMKEHMPEGVATEEEAATKKSD